MPVRVSHFDNDTRIPSLFGSFDDDIEAQIRQERVRDPSVTNLNEVYNLRAHLKILDDPMVIQEYELSKKRYFDITSILPSASIFYVSAATRYNWSHITSNEGPFFLASHILIFGVTVIFSLYFISNLVIYYTPEEKRERLSYKISEKILLSGFGGRIEDILCVLTILYQGFCLLARVYKGQCENTTNIWESQG